MSILQAYDRNLRAARQGRLLWLLPMLSVRCLWPRCLWGLINQRVQETGKELMESERIKQARETYNQLLHTEQARELYNLLLHLKKHHFHPPPVLLYMLDDELRLVERGREGIRLPYLIKKATQYIEPMVHPCLDS